MGPIDKGPDDKPPAKDKKEKGGKIQGQNAPTPSKGRSYEAPPSGISLDQVHEQVLSDL